jgi:hypothetical protein
MNRFHFMFGMLLYLGACASTQDARTLSLEGKSDRAILLIDIADQDLAYTLNIVRFDPSTGQTLANSFGGWASFRVKSDSSRYLAITVPSDYYVVQDVTQQDTWAVCFHESSYYFNAEPGQITYLGKFSAAKNLAQLQFIAIKTGQTYSINREVIHFFDDIFEPSFDLTETSIDAGRSFALKEIPGAANFSFEAANLQSTKFNTGRSLFGQRLCGGYNIGNKNQKVND